MNPGILGLALFVRDLLVQPEGSVVQIGRDNFRREDFTALQIVIDSLSLAQRLGTNEIFDEDNEVISIDQAWALPCTINFYGDGGYAQAEKLSLLVRSQIGYELQRDSGVTIREVQSITDVKLLTGEQYSERYEVAVNVRYVTAIDIPTLRIDTLEWTVITDAGASFDFGESGIISWMEPVTGRLIADGKLYADQKLIG